MEKRSGETRMIVDTDEAVAASEDFTLQDLSFEHDASGIRNDDGSLRPIFHTIRGLCAAFGRPAARFGGLPDGAIGMRFDDGMIVAGYSLVPVAIGDAPAPFARLGTDPFQTASHDVNWIGQNLKRAGGPVPLAPRERLFARSGVTT